jgi:iron(II)-dependent oxidoreductase
VKLDQDARKEQIRKRLEMARVQTMRLFEHVPDEFLKSRVHEFYSPVGWHFGHIGMTEEHWVIVQAMNENPRDEALSFLFANLPENPKDNRIHLPSRDEIVDYLDSTRDAVLNALASADLNSDNRLLFDGYAWEYSYRHECQHQESIAELLQLVHQASAQGPFRSSIPWKCTCVEETVSIPAGEFFMGTDDLHAYDNEKRAQKVTVAPFVLDIRPVTTFAWSEFMMDGGYYRRNLWSEAGWEWRKRENAERPEYWAKNTEGSGFVCFGPLGPRSVHPDEPVMGISWYEADAFARWIGKRLPTEAEWEFAARHEPLGLTGLTGRSSLTKHIREYPWGNTQPNVHLAHFGLNSWSPTLVGSCPDGASAFGVRDMAGNVWEWTSSAFLPYPGFESFPYDGYSKEHMDGNHYVCRGGSWATAAPNLRSSFRNWYVPTYRQGFLGLRCAL